MRTQDIPPHLHERYGIRPPSPWRWVAAALAALLVLPVLGYAGWRYAASQQRPFALIDWRAQADGTVQVHWQLDPTDGVRWCAIRAQDFEHFDVGFAVVPVAAGVHDMRYLLRATEHPLAVDVLQCDGDPYGLPGPQFRPGQLPPAQDLPGLAPGVHTTVELQALR